MSEKVRLLKLWILVLVATTAIVYAEGAIKSGQWFYEWDVTKTALLEILPNLAADGVALLIGYAVFRRSARGHYVKTMREVRLAVKEMPEDVKLSDRQARALMKGLVPLISELYFNDKLPEPNSSHLGKEFEKVGCTTCGQSSCRVVEGRCIENCHDIPESWTDSKLVEISGSERRL